SGRSCAESICRSSTARRSACSAPTAPANRRCCASWRASIRSSSARPFRPTVCASATSRKSRSSTRRRMCAATWRTAWPRGARRRVALCRLLLSRPDMLLLDEPTNHLDAESVAWLERFLDDYPGTVVAITHDRYFLDNVAKWILELDRGHGIPWEGNYTSWL